MELRHLRYFAAVAAHGSFSRAAEVLNITQPPLSRQVKDLEYQLGVELLVRGTNSVSLTQAGEVFYEEARAVLARAEKAVQRVQDRSGQEVLTVGYAPSLATGIMPAALAKFQAAVPGVKVVLSDLTSRDMSEMTSSGRFDMILIPGFFDQRLVKGFHFTNLMGLKPVIVLPKQHPLAKLKEFPISHLHDLPLVGLAKDKFPEYLPAIHEVFESYNIVLNFVSLVDNGVCPLFEEMMNLNAPTILNEGILSILPRSMVMKSFAPRPPLVSVLLGLPTVKPKVHAEMFARVLTEEVRSRRKTPPSRLQRAAVAEVEIR